MIKEIAQVEAEIELEIARRDGLLKALNINKEASQ